MFYQKRLLGLICVIWYTNATCYCDTWTCDGYYYGTYGFNSCVTNSDSYITDYWGDITCRYCQSCTTVNGYTTCKCPTQGECQNYGLMAGLIVAGVCICVFCCIIGCCKRRRGYVIYPVNTSGYNTGYNSYPKPNQPIIVQPQQQTTVGVPYQPIVAQPQPQQQQQPIYWNAQPQQNVVIQPQTMQGNQNYGTNLNEGQPTY